MVISEEDFEGNVLSSIRGQGFKYIRANKDNPRGLPTEALYDMVTDQAELKNIAASEDSFCGMYQTDRSQELGKELGEAIVQAAKGAAATSQACMSSAEIQRLVALGYMDAAAADQQACEE